jgi:hypothetical protein
MKPVNPKQRADGAGARAGEMYSPMYSTRWVDAYGCRAWLRAISDVSVILCHVIVCMDVFSVLRICMEMAKVVCQDAGLVRSPCTARIEV